MVHNFSSLQRQKLRVSSLIMLALLTLLFLFDSLQHLNVLWSQTSKHVCFDNIHTVPALGPSHLTNESKDEF